MGKFDLKKAFSLVDEGRITGLAEELIRVPSVTGEERGVMHRTKTLMEESGLPVELRGSEARPVVLSTLNPDASPFLVLNGHLDTVPIADPRTWAHDPFDPFIDGGRLYGRGASDMKASCAVIVHVLDSKSITLFNRSYELV